MVITTRPLSGLARTIERCPCCQSRKRHVIRLYEWYDCVRTCCGCGNTWTGGHCLPTTADERVIAIVLAKQAWYCATDLTTALRGLVEAQA